MAKATGLLTESTSLTVDPVITTDGTSRYKRAVGAQSAGLDHSVADQGVASQVDDAAFTPATSTIVVIGAFADETSPDSVNEGDGGAVRMTLARNLHVVNVADAAAITSVASQDTNITILAANANRIGATIFNNDTGPLYIKFGATATATTSCTAVIAAGGYYEVPAPVYRGIIDGIWTTSGSGSANVTELT
jgi:hypothetical protein